MLAASSAVYVLAFFDELAANRGLLERWALTCRDSDPFVLLVWAGPEEHDVADSLLRRALGRQGSGASGGYRITTATDIQSEIAARLRGVYSADDERGGRFGDLPVETNWGALRNRLYNELDAESTSELPYGPPDFVGVGAQKAGTTWWTNLVAQHPEISVPRKERHYFDGLGDQPPDSAVTEGYHRLFRRPPGVIAGEFTPDYMFRPWVLPLLHHAAPDARVLVLLRDPLERYVSGLSQVVRSLGELRQRDRGQQAERSLYAGQLERVYDLYPKDRVLVLQYERCVLRPRREYQRTITFLGVRDSSFVPRGFKRRLNRTEIAKPEISPDEVEELVEAAREDALRLMALVPELDLTLWPCLRSD